MKNLFKITFAAITLLISFACGTQSNIPPANITALLQNNEFTFMAEHANPNNADVVNAMNSIPGGSASRMLDLDYGYTIEIRKDKLDVTLPYFGRMYQSSMDPSKNSYRFSSKDFTITNKEGKKGSSIFTIVTNDQQNTTTINIQVYKNGKAYVWVDSNDRQAISYDGYIMANTAVKK